MRFLLIAGFVLACVLFAGPARAATPCETATQALRNADNVLSEADAAIATKNTQAARTLYANAMTQLQALPWTPLDATCDAKRFAFAKLVALDHSLVVAIAINEINAIDARDHEAQMWRGLDAIAPGLMTGATYGDLQDQAIRYAKRIDLAWRAAEVALHTPAGAGCAVADAPPIVVDPVKPGLPHQPAAGATLQVEVLVTLSPDGKVLKTAIQASSGDTDFDAAVLLAARSSGYLPQIHNCMRIASTYIFHAIAQ